MAEAKDTLISRADLNSVSTPATGRQLITVDGLSNDAASWTGLRDISGLLVSGRTTAGRLLVGRKDEHVVWVFAGLTLASNATGSWQLVDSTGANSLQQFRPFYTETHDYLASSAGDLMRLAVNANATVNVNFAKPGLVINTVVHTFTMAGWPTTLPGAADGQSVVI